jgi:2-phospho-L-lactate guanylyltransferase
MKTIAVLPMKGFAQAKQRLAASLAPEARRALAAAMLGDVLGALRGVRGLEGVVVVAAEEDARALAIDHGATVVADSESAGQSAAARLGIARALRDGAERVLLVPGDCPALDASELNALLTDETPPVVIIPDRHGSGTNALLLRPPDAIEPGFGPGSRARHEERARAAGVAWAVRELPSLTLDVDTPDDLAALRARPEGATRTRALLGLAQAPGRRAAMFKRT